MARPSIVPALISSLVLSLILGLAPAADAAPKRGKKKKDAMPELPAPMELQGLEWREVGPYRGGRSAAVAGIPSQPLTYYFGATGGGVWKTADGGQRWENVSDGYFGGSIGAVAVSEWDPNVVYVGGGEKTVRGNVSHGRGVWKSTDAGQTWTHVGLADSRHIPRIRIHPKDPDRVYVAALGHLFGPNEERGVYRSTDGGESWEAILQVSPEVGAVDLAMDPTNPRILYASFWRVLRTPYSLESGGEGSGLWKSTDGGDSWTELSGNPGFPKGTLGIIGITVSPTNPQNLYAIVEAEKGGVFRSRDGGATWAKTNDERKLRQRAWYYTRIYADPADEEAVYVVNVRFHRSKDGGRSFTAIPTPHGDNHDLWIAPDDPLRMIEANDGGANVSFDGGETWSPQDNQPTSQLYRVSTDNAFPYRMLAGQQDNSALRIRSRSLRGRVIGPRDWEPTAGGESGHIVAKPDDPDVVYGGSYGGFLVRLDHRTGAMRALNVWPDDPMGWGAAELKYRFNWNFPLFFSPHDDDRLYAAGNVLFASDDAGATWKPISPDLTRDDKSKMGPSGGPITKDNTSVEYYGTIFAAVESPHEAGVLWTGSDDGLVHLSRDGGANWTHVTPPQMPEWTQVNSIEAHPFEPGGLYVAATSYKSDDFTPYLYRTTDYGATWRRIDRGIDRGHFTRVIRADPERRGLLFAGTEEGLYASFDDGASWQSAQLNLPIVPITDLAIKEGDLIAATQGRGLWILDDLSPLRQLERGAEAGLQLFEPPASHRIGGGGGFRPPGNGGTNPPAGVILTYRLAEEPEPKTEMKMEIRDAAGEVVRTYTRKPAEAAEGPPRGRDRGEDLRQLPSAAGLNRFAWDLSYPPAEGFPGMILWNGRGGGPMALPGRYTARLEVGEESAEVSFEILPNPNSTSSPAELKEQFDFLVETRDKLTETHREIGRIREAREQVDALLERLGDAEEHAEVVEGAKALKEKLDASEKVLYQTQNRSRQDPLNFPIRLNDKLAGVMGLVSMGDGAPTPQAEAVRRELTAAIDAELKTLETIWEEDLPALNDRIRQAEIPALLLEPRDEEAEESSP